MEITVSGRHLEITDAIRAYATEKLAKLPRYFDRVQLIEVVADKAENHGHSVEVIVRVEHAEPIIARSSGQVLYACIDDVVDKLERQLTDHKEKVRNRRHSPTH